MDRKTYCKTGKLDLAMSVVAPDDLWMEVQRRTGGTSHDVPDKITKFLIGVEAAIRSEQIRISDVIAPEDVCVYLCSHGCYLREFHSI